MFDLRQLFAKSSPAREVPQEDEHGDSPPLRSKEGLEIEYHALICSQLQRLAICDTCANVDVRRLGKGPHGFDVLIGMVRLYRWERTSALRLLVGLPLIEARVRKLVRGTWLADYSHFGGLWLHASEQLHEDPGVNELKELLATLTPAQTTDSTASSFADSGPDAPSPRPKGRPVSSPNTR